MYSINKFISDCKGGVEIIINGHKTYNQTLEEYICDENQCFNQEDITPEIRKDMLENDRIIEIIMYVPNSVDYYIVVDSDFDRAMIRSLEFSDKINNIEESDFDLSDKEWIHKIDSDSIKLEDII